MSCDGSILGKGLGATSLHRLMLGKDMDGMTERSEEAKERITKGIST